MRKSSNISALISSGYDVFLHYLDDLNDIKAHRRLDGKALQTFDTAITDYDASDECALGLLSPLLAGWMRTFLDSTSLEINLQTESFFDLLIGREHMLRLTHHALNSTEQRPNRKITSKAIHCKVSRKSRDG